MRGDRDEADLHSFWRRSRRPLSTPQQHFAASNTRRARHKPHKYKNKTTLENNFSKRNRNRKRNSIRNRYLSLKSAPEPHSHTLAQQLTAPESLGRNFSSGSQALRHCLPRCRRLKAFAEHHAAEAVSLKHRLAEARWAVARPGSWPLGITRPRRVAACPRSGRFVYVFEACNTWLLLHRGSHVLLLAGLGSLVSGRSLCDLPLEKPD